MVSVDVGVAVRKDGIFGMVIVGEPDTTRIIEIDEPCESVV